MTNKLAVVNPPAHRTYTQAVPDEKIALLLPSRDVEGRYAIVESITEPGAATPQHVHSGDEVIYVAEGEMTFLIDGNLTIATAGSLVFVPAGVIHAFKNRSQSRVKMLAFFSPGGIDEVLEKFADLSFAEIEQLSARYGTRIIGPPIAN